MTHDQPDEDEDRCSADEQTNTVQPFGRLARMRATLGRCKSTLRRLFR